jgi:hypothetical protein
MKAVLLSKDLMFISRVKEVAAACGGEVAVVKNEAALAEAIGTPGSAQSGVVLLDLEKCPIALEVVERTVAGLSKDSWRCISFFSHVHVETADDARRRGLGEVMPRSKFVQVLPGLFGA